MPPVSIGNSKQVSDIVSNRSCMVCGAIDNPQQRATI